MSGFTMPSWTLFAPSGTTDGPLGLALCPDAGTTLRCSWSATGTVSFTAHFRNRSNNALVGAQVFTNSTGGNWTWSGDGGYNSTTPWSWEIDSVTSNGHNITFTLSVDSGTPYSGVRVRRSGGWVFAPVYVRRSGSWVFVPMYVRRSGAWTLAHK